MVDKHYITRRIEIDAGHRIPDHKSKCKNLHGHRYEIWATCEGELFDAGEQKGMVLDFGFLKQAMVDEIDQWCDHGLMLYVDDPLVPRMLGENQSAEDYQQLKILVDRDGSSPMLSHPWGKLYFLDVVPTAENLARHWFNRLNPIVKGWLGEQGGLVSVRVFETPNCYSDFPGDF